jgi:hypothetical protein
MANLRLALRSHGLGRVRLGTALAASYPPSAGVFCEDIAESVMLLLLCFFLNTSGSNYFVDAYPYLTWAGNRKTISLHYALLQGTASIILQVVQDASSRRVKTPWNEPKMAWPSY